MNRWTITDTEIGFTFEINPLSGGSFSSGRTVTKLKTTTGDPVVFLGRSTPRTTEISGVVRTKSQYDDMIAWFQLMRQVLLTDDLGRQTWVYMQELNFRPEPRRQSPWRHTYTAKLMEVNGD